MLMESERRRSSFAAFLLAQVGAQGAKQFGDRLSVVKLTPPHAGILRLLSHSPGISQRELAARLGMHASRLVGIVDEMEMLGLVVREGNTDDRRTYSLQITPKGREKMVEISAIAREHNEALCAALSEEEREVLVGLLQRIADQQGLMRGVHPGFNSLRGSEGRSGRRSPVEGEASKDAVGSDAVDG